MRLSEASRAVIQSRASGCFLCKRLLEVVDGDELRPWPASGPVEFPVAGQRDHVRLETRK